MDKNKLRESLTQAIENGKGKKFTQTIELILNFKGLDFKKPEERVNLDLVLPKGKGKTPKIGMFADGDVAMAAKKAGIEVVLGKADIEKIAGNKAEIKKLLERDWLAQPQLMSVIGKVLGQVLGARGKMPRPVMPNMTIQNVMEQAKMSISLKGKGKYLPTIQCPIGIESMPIDDIAENISFVIETIQDKYGKDTLGNVYVKTTMGKPVKLNVGG